MNYSEQAGIVFPYIRQIRVDFSNLGGRSGRDLSLLSDGSQNHPAISCQVQKTIASLPAATQIMIWNLNANHRQAFTRNQTKVTISAGWRHGPGSGMPMIFKGEVLAAQSNRADADIVTTIHAMNSHEVTATTAVSKTYAAGMSVERVIRDLAGLLSDVNIGVIKDVHGAIGPGGFSVFGSVGAALNSLGRQFGFNWTITNDTFQALGDGDTIASGVVLTPSDIIAVSPILNGPGQWQRGVTVKTRFNPNLAPGNLFTVRSSVDESLNGSYYANTITHNLETFGNDFSSTVVGYY